MTASRANVCVAACADAWRDDGAVLASAFGIIPVLGARLARLTSAPDLLISDGEAYVLGDTPAFGEAGVVESYLPFASVFDLVAAGKRHVMMVPSQVDRFGNINLSCIGDHEKPSRMLIGARGAPGNTVNHPTSYWVPNHSPRVFVEDVDFVSGIGYDRARAAGAEAQRYHEIRVVVTNLCVLDFETPNNSMRLRSVHPGVEVDHVVEATGFSLVIPDEVPSTREPDGNERKLIAELDPKGLRTKEVP